MEYFVKFTLVSCSLFSSGQILALYPNVKNLQELDTLEPKDKWIVRVEDEDSDFYYDGEKAAWIEIPCSSTNYIRYVCRKRHC